MKTKILSIIMLVGIVVSMFAFIPKAQAWGPVSHVTYVEEALRQVGNNSITDLIQGTSRRFAMFRCGLMFPDITVILYYTEFKKYEATHTWNFFQDLWNDAVQRNSKEAQAFALGVGTHLIQDSFTHNQYVPEKIKKGIGLFGINIPLFHNVILHPLVEAVIETERISSSTTAQYLAQTAFNYWNEAFQDGNMKDDLGVTMRVIDWSSLILGKDQADWYGYANTFANILGDTQSGGFYGKGGYLPYGMGSLWGIYNSLSGIFVVFVDISDYAVYRDATIQATVDWWSSGLPAKPDAYAAGDPTGIANIEGANQTVYAWTVAVVAVLFVFVYLIFFRYRSRWWRRGQV